MDHDFFDKAQSSIGLQQTFNKTGRTTNTNQYDEKEIMQAFKDLIHPQQAKYPPVLNEPNLAPDLTSHFWLSNLKLTNPKRKN